MLVGKPANQRCTAGACHLELARGFKTLDRHYMRTSPFSPSPPPHLSRSPWSTHCLLEPRELVLWKPDAVYCAAGCSRTMEEGHLTLQAVRLLKDAGVNELYVVTAAMALGFDWQDNFMEFHEARGIYDLASMIATGDYEVGADLPDELRLYEMVSPLPSPPPSTPCIPRRIHTHMPPSPTLAHIWQHNTHSLPTTRTH